MTIYLLGAFLLSLICGLVFTPIILDYCKRKKLYDIPNDRKVHKNAIPRLGGISFFPSMITAFLVILLLLPVSDEHTLPVTIWSAIFMMGLLLIYITGIIDDLTGLNAKTKFAIQIITGSLLPFAGLYINNLYGFLGIYEIPYYIGIPMTIFLMVFIDNAINLIDGIDEHWTMDDENSRLSTLDSQLPKWYTLDGRCLGGKPTKRGLYLHDGQKIVISGK